MKNKIKIENKGFTLIEMMVALGIFVIALTISLGAVLKFKDVQRSTAAINQVQENLRFGLEHMAKEMRTGKNFSCSNCNGGDNVAFTNAKGENVSYKLENNRLKKSTAGGVYFPLTSPRVRIESLEFFANGISNSDGQQPKILVKIKSSIRDKNAVINFNLQTLISSRNPDS